MNDADSIYYRQLQKDAETFANQAMAILVSMQGHQKTAVKKDDMDESTDADIEAEKIIINNIRKKYPTHSIYSEEAGETKGTEPYRWVIDPLDQTKEYIRGGSEYNRLIAVEYESSVVAGVSLLHGVNILYTGSKGNGASYNGKPLRVSPQQDIRNSFIGFNLPNRNTKKEERDTDMNLLSTLIDTTYRVRPFWDQTKAMGWVGRGILDANIAPPHLFKWHDIASSIILVQEAGGVVTDWLGNAVTEKTSGYGILASNGILHEQLLEIIKKSKEGTL